MAKLEIDHGEERLVTVTLSRRNLLALLHKLDMPGSARRIENNDCWEDGVQCTYPGTTLVLCCEDDYEHYSKRAYPPGYMHPDTETFITEKKAEAVAKDPPHPFETIWEN